VVIALAGCGLLASSPGVGSETHFLSPCTSECEQGLECLAGVCTLPCGGDAECSPLDAAATCRASRTTQPDSCQVACTSDDQCGARNPAWACDVGRCAARSPLRLESAVATPSAASCTRISPLTQLADAQTTAESVPATTDVLMAVGDPRGLYWIETDGSVLGLASSSSASVTLRPGGDASTFFTGMVADESRLYWVEASNESRSGSNLPGEATTWIFSAPKLGGLVETSAESKEILYPLGIAGQNMIVGTRAGQLRALENGALRPLDHIRYSTTPQIVDGALYWLEQGNDPNRVDVLSATVAPGAAQRRTSFEGYIPPTAVRGGAQFETIYPSSYLIGPGFVLWSERQLREPGGTVVNSLRHIDSKPAARQSCRPPTGCAHRCCSTANMCTG